MTLFIQPVAVNDLTSLQSGIQFFTNTAEATAEVASINASPANGPGDSVFIYASKLLNSNLSLSQVAMADSAIMEGGTVAIGNTTTTNTLTYFATQFLPGQVAVAAKFGFNQTVFAAETLGLALAGTAGFQSNFGSLSQAAFITAVSTATGVPTSFLTTFLTNWLNFFNGVGKAAVPAGFTALQAAEGATFGDGIGASLLAPTSANLQTTFSTNASGPNKFSPNTVSGVVANALINIAEDTANGTPGTLYKTGVSLASLPAHTPLFGEFVAAPTTNVFLTTGIDNATNGFSTSPTGSPVLNGFTATASNTTVSGTFGGAGATWTPGDQVTASTGTTGQIFNITGNGTLGSINVTNLPTNKVSGFQTLNVIADTVLGAIASEAVIGDFTAKGPMGDWTGLTTLNVNSGSNLSFVDTLTADPTTAVNVTDTSITTSVGSPMTVNGGSVITIIENNLGGGNFGGIVVNGGTGTTKVSITQTEPFTSNDGFVTITDAGFATKAAGTITDVTLDGLSGDVHGFVQPFNTINDNALANLTVAHSDTQTSDFIDSGTFTVSTDNFITDNVGAVVVINNNETATKATTLNLTLTANGIAPDGDTAAALLIIDTNNEISTLHLTLGNQNSFTDFIFNGLTKLDTPNPGTGALTAFIEDTVATAVNFDFSGLNGPNTIEVDRQFSGNNADVYTLGNFGTNMLDKTGSIPFAANPTSQFLDIDNDTQTNNTATINFGSGAYQILSYVNDGGHTFNNTAPNGAFLGTLNINGLGGDTSVAPFALIDMEQVAVTPANAEFFTFSAATAISQLFTPGVSLGAFGSVLAGAQLAAATLPAHQAGYFTIANAGSVFNGDTFAFGHTDASSSFTANDALVGFVGLHDLTAISAAHVITIV